MIPLEVEHLSKVVKTGFLGKKTQLLDDVSFKVGDGAIVGFVGANGAGKSTTIRHIVGVARPTSGSVKLFGRDPRVPAHRKGLGFLPETTSFAQNLSPMLLLRQQAALAGVALGDAEAHQRLERVGLVERAHSPIGKFSKGMRQRLGIALALIDDPKLLILDEPMSGLDPGGRELMRSIIRGEGERGCAVLFSSHVLSDVESLCSDVVVINKGRIVYSGGVRSAVGEKPRAWEIDLVPAEGIDVAALVGGAVHRRHGSVVSVVVAADADPLERAGRLRAAGGNILAVRSLEPKLEERLLELMS